jgi:AcrR family transcriptional regulator
MEGKKKAVRGAARQAKSAGRAAGAGARKQVEAKGSRVTGERTRAAAEGRGKRRAVGRPAKQPKGAGGSAESTEERIKQAARKLFTQHGFAAVRTRDIAREAGINLALLNYYFRSKQKLFDLVMMENFRKFLSGMTVNFQDPSLTIEDRLKRIVAAYVDFLTEFPDLPLFILNEIRGNPSKIAEQIRQEVGPARSAFFKELQEAKKDGRIELDPAHFVINLVGLTVFPFVARPLLLRVTGVSDEQFLELMEERKKLVPMWIMMMMTTKMPAEPGSKK